MNKYIWVVRVFRVSWPNTRITHTNFGYRALEPELGFGFFRLGFFIFGLRVSSFFPGHNYESLCYPYRTVYVSTGTGAEGPTF